MPDGDKRTELDWLLDPWIRRLWKKSKGIPLAKRPTIKKTITGEEQLQKWQEALDKYKYLPAELVETPEQRDWLKSEGWTPILGTFGQDIGKGWTPPPAKGKEEAPMSPEVAENARLQNELLQAQIANLMSEATRYRGSYGWGWPQGIAPTSEGYTAQLQQPYGQPMMSWQLPPGQGEVREVGLERIAQAQAWESQHQQALNQLSKQPYDWINWWLASQKTGPAYSSSARAIQYGGRATPPAPQWMPQLVTQAVAGKPIQKWEVTPPSAQQYAALPWTTREQLAGYMDWVRPGSFLEMGERLAASYPEAPTAGQRWAPTRRV